jgi:hypothetical protein
VRVRGSQLIFGGDESGALMSNSSGKRYQHDRRIGGCDDKSAGKCSHVAKALERALALVDKLKDEGITKQL